ncbi:MAG: helix-turn-helix domain-containing protein [Acidobacteriota bacterium]|nr:helix-turn-helix domain-containing protein [Acidobacteriota bacterium]MDH3783873.1 helix-turn-helix domain-containing protein [Acidobacteriota bacterium]
MRELDKKAMGRRIRQIRLTAEMRQWEIARLLGTTQSAIHKYENGVVPEPRRLVEVARIGNTSVEWVLTGHHWENGSEDQPRITPELLETACLLREVEADERVRLSEALRIMREAARAVQEEMGSEDAQSAVLAEQLATHSTQTVKLLEAACRIQKAVLSQVTEDAERRLESPHIAGGDAS